MSVVLFCSQNVEFTPQILEQLLEFLGPRQIDHELIIALDGHLGGLQARFAERTRDLPWVRVVRLHGAQGQVATIRAGAAVARGDRIVTYPAFPQVRPEAIDAAASRLDEAEYVVGYREDRAGSGLNRIASRGFNRLVAWTTGQSFHDVACGLHGFRAYVSRAISGYGQNQLFLPILLSREGFRVAEVAVPAERSAPSLRLFGPGTFARRSLDIVTLAYLVRFTQKPLRPFGALGALLLVVGFVLGGILVYQRLVQGQALAERPLLLLALLLVTAGIQVIILGFLGELLLYLHFRDQANYRVAEWFHGQDEGGLVDAEAASSEVGNASAEASGWERP